MAVVTDKNERSICDDDPGPATTCLSQIPFTINGCNNTGFAFSRVPGGKSMCGKNFLFEFTGKGKDVNREHYKLLMGEKLIVVAADYDYNDINA